METAAYRRHLQRARDALQAAVADVVADVPAEIVRWPTADAIRSARAEVVEVLGRYPAACVGGFADALEALTEDVAPAGRSRRLDLDSLGIMDDQRVQEEIEVVQAGRVLADDAAAPLHRLQRLESALRAQSQHHETSPVGPATIGRALWRATEGLPLSLAARTEAVRCAIRLLGPRLGPLYTMLVEQARQIEGLDLPADAPMTRMASVYFGDRPATDAARRGEMPARPQPTVRASAPRAALAAPLPFDVTRPGALLDLMDARATAARRADAESTLPVPLEGDGAKIPRLIHRHRDAFAELDPRAMSADAHRLIGRIFDEIVGDPALGAGGGQWIGRLQPAVLRLASRDPGLLQTHRHPAWTLVNQLATLFGDDGARRPPNLDAWLERVLMKLREEPSRERFESIDRKLAAWRADQARRQLTEVAPALDLLRRHAMFEEGAEAARRRLERRLDASRADAVVRRFISTIWALVCARQEADEPPAAGGSDAWDIATDLIWSASPARSRLDSPTLVTMIPALVDRLTAGMDRLGIAADVQDAWLERLAALHVRALRRSPEEAQTDMPLTIDLALEDELPPAEAPPAPSPERSGHETPAPDLVVGLLPGDRFGVEIQGAWEEVSLVWRSDNGNFLLLARADGGTLSMSRRSLQRLLGEGLAVLPEAGGVLARAARRIAEDES